MSAPELTTMLEGSWQRRLDLLVRTMRELSTATDPQTMVQNYAARIRQLLPSDGFLGLSRRGLEAPDI